MSPLPHKSAAAESEELLCTVDGVPGGTAVLGVPPPAPACRRPAPHVHAPPPRSPTFYSLFEVLFAVPSATMALAGSQLQLLDLPPDVLVAILSRLPFLERLRLSLVCR